MQKGYLGLNFESKMMMSVLYYMVCCVYIFTMYRICFRCIIFSVILGEYFNNGNEKNEKDACH